MAFKYDPSHPPWARKRTDEELRGLVADLLRPNYEEDRRRLIEILQDSLAPPPDIQAFMNLGRRRGRHSSPLGKDPFEIEAACKDIRRVYSDFREVQRATPFPRRKDLRHMFEESEAEMSFSTWEKRVGRRQARKDWSCRITRAFGPKFAENYEAPLTSIEAAALKAALGKTDHGRAIRFVRALGQFPISTRQFERIVRDLRHYSSSIMSH